LALINRSTCSDTCAYKKDGNSDPGQLFCFKTEGATHSVECQRGTTPAQGGEHGVMLSIQSEPGGSAGCDYSKDNLSWGEYQTKVPMPASASAPYTVMITFDADTTIVMLVSLFSPFLQGSCHSNCQQPIACEGKVCTIDYTGSIPVELFNVKKVPRGEENDRSNIVSVSVNGHKMC
jgi:hypothetical protein